MLGLGEPMKPFRVSVESLSLALMLGVFRP